MSPTHVAVASILALAPLLPPAPQAAEPQDPGQLEKKALLIFVDGLLPLAIPATETPAIDRLMRHAAHSFRARAESTTISGSGWSSFLTGVHWDKHGVPDNAFETPRFETYPHLFRRLKQARPAAVVASAQSWKPIEEGLVTPSEPDFASFHDYYAYSDDYWDEESCDALCTADMLRFLAQPELDLAVMMFGELDGVAHSDGNRNYTAASPLYRKMLARIDGYIGRMLDAIEARPGRAREDWLIVISTDHAGSPDSGHGRNTPAHREVPFIVSGAAVVPGEIWPPPKTPDVAATALHHLGVAIDPAWDFDGRPVGFAATAAPQPRLGENLIFNGGGEHERGFAGYGGFPDASIAGWRDDGWMTLVRYGSPGGFPGVDDPAPSGTGPATTPTRVAPQTCFFAGGPFPEGTSISQTIELGALRSAIDSGLSFELSAWLGVRAGRGDRASLRVGFQDAAGALLSMAFTGPADLGGNGGRTGFHLRSVEGPVPPRTARAVVTLSARPGSDANHAYADELSLVFRR